MPADALAEIYADVDRELGEDARCTACGKCCDFAANSYRLYASQLEVEYVVRHTGRKPVLVDGRCCFQGSSGECTIHQWRPLGCRTYFCSRAHTQPDGPRRAEEIYESALGRIKSISDRHGREWRYAHFFDG